MHRSNSIRFSAFGLHIFAMCVMLFDHIGAVFCPNMLWMRFVGRLSFPVFAFLLAEGYAHTGSLKKYVLRLLAAALISEIPFDLMASGTWLDLSHQNVLFTFLLAILAMKLLDLCRIMPSRAGQIVSSLCVLLLVVPVGMLMKADYEYVGIYTVLMFYYLKGSSVQIRLSQLAVYFCIQMVLACSFSTYYLNILLQETALLGLIPIWFYSGARGKHNRMTKILFYGFYPVHMAVLTLLHFFVKA